MRERDRLLREIQMCSFYMTDLQLYLNTHPNCANARKMYRQHAERQKMLQERYVAQYGPILAEQAGCGDTWDWVSAPWPWEGGNC